MSIASVGFRNGVMVAKNVNFEYKKSPQDADPGIITADAQLLIGSVTTTPDVAMSAGILTSPDASVTIGYVYPNITLQAAGAITTLTGNSGGPISPIAHNINIETAGTTVLFTGTPGQLTLDFGIDNLIMGSLAAGILGALHTTGVGFGSLGSITSGSNNSALGTSSLALATSTLENTALGSNALAVLQTGTGENTAVGVSSLSSLLTGSSNIALGHSAGSALQGAETSNIYIGSLGVLGESNTTRIGSATAGTGSGEQDRAFLTGVYGVTVAASAPVGVATTGQLSSLGFGTANQVLTSGGAGVSPSWQSFVNGSLLPFAYSAGISLPNRNTLYYYQSVGGVGTFTAAYNYLTRYLMPVDGTITRVSGYFTTGSVGTNEATPVYLYVNNVNVATVEAAVDFSLAAFSFSNIALAVPVVTGDTLSFVLSTPNWAVVPRFIEANLTAVLSA